jgi:glycosyltransferase involved in cell wall biosynthesis
VTDGADRESAAGGHGLRVGIDVSAIPTELTGAGRYVVELTGALVRGTGVVLDLFARRDDAERWRERAPAPHVVHAVAPASRSGRLAFGELALGHLARRSHPPITLFFGPHYTFPLGTADPVVVTLHDLTLVEHPEWHEGVKARYFSRAIRRAAARAAGIVVPSAEEAERFVRTYAPRGEVVVIPHGIDHDRFTPIEPHSGADRAVRRTLGIGDRYVLTVGTIEPRKHHVTLLRAFERLAIDDPALELVIVGKRGWGTEAFDRALAGTPHAGRVHVLGFVPDTAVAALLRGAACVAYPSAAEGFGIPALEALACGASLVTTTGTPMATLAADAGWFAPPGDVDALAGAISGALRPGAERERRRARGLEIAGRYTWDASAAAHVALWQRVAERQGSVTRS